MPDNYQTFKQFETVQNVKCNTTALLRRYKLQYVKCNTTALLRRYKLQYVKCNTTALLRRYKLQYVKCNANKFFYFQKGFQFNITDMRNKFYKTVPLSASWRFFTFFFNCVCRTYNTAFFLIIAAIDFLVSTNFFPRDSTVEGIA